MSQYRSKRNAEDGFTLVEVLVGLLVMVGFISTAMQALVTATVFKVKGQELSEATTWIQEDVEKVAFEANQLDFDRSASKHTPELAACQAMTKDEGYAARLKEKINRDAPVDGNKSSTIGNRPYTLKRTAKLPDASPYTVLSLEYEVASADNPIPISIQYTTIIPDASLACP